MATAEQAVVAAPAELLSFPPAFPCSATLELLSLPASLEHASRRDQELSAHSLGYFMRASLAFAEQIVLAEEEYGGEENAENENVAGTREPLTVDEFAAWHLYTQETPLYRILNARMRTASEVGPHTLAPFAPLIHLLLSGLRKLPARPRRLFRVIFHDPTRNDCSSLAVGAVLRWNAFSSCSVAREALELPRTMYTAPGHRILFHIDAIAAHDITTYSAVHGEGEWVLPPGAALRVVRVLAPTGSSTTINVDLQQLPFSSAPVFAGIPAALTMHLAPAIYPLNLPSSGPAPSTTIAVTARTTAEEPHRLDASPALAFTTALHTTPSSLPRLPSLALSAAALAGLAALGVRDEDDLAVLDDSDLDTVPLSPASRARLRPLLAPRR